MAGARTRSLPEGTVTFLFTDIEGSTRLLRTLGDGWGDVLEQHFEVIRAAASEHSGVELGTDGDAVKLAFARPSDAVATAVAVQCALADHMWPEGHEVRVRIGIHTGEVDRRGDDYVGITLHLTARVAALGHGGQILVTEATRAVVPTVDTIDLGEHELRDFPDPVRLYQVAVPGQLSTFPPLRSTTSLPNNLPAEIDRFVGRATELAGVAKRLGEHRLVTLTGPGGCGKTRLALEAAREMLPSQRDGVWLVELAPLAEPGQVVPAIASALGVREKLGVALIDQLTDWLRDRRLLIVLDNCEHLIAAGREVVHAVLRSCPGVRVMTTSRELLGLPGEAVVLVPPMDTAVDDVDPLSADAAQLFVERALCAAPTFEATTPRQAELVVQLCRRLDGLPLALELAAARLRTLPLPQLVERLDDRFSLLTTGSAAGDGRQRTLESVVGWSHDLLDDSERALFRRLSVFPDTFNLDAVEAVGGGRPLAAGQELDTLARLVDKSLVTVMQGSGRTARYRLLETMRQFGRQRLQEAGEAGESEDRLVAWCLRLVERVENDIRTTRQDAAMAAVAPEALNARAVLTVVRERGDLLTALRIVAAVPLGLDGERRNLLIELLDAAPDAPDRYRALAYATLANLAVDRADAAEVIEYATRYLHAAEANGDAVHQAWARYFLVHGLWAAGDVSDAASLAQEGIARFEALGIEHGVAYLHWAAALLASDVTTAERLVAIAEERFRRLDMPSGLAHSLEARGLIALRTHHPARARGDLAEALAIMTAAGNAGCTAHCVEAAAAYAAELGWLQDAAELVGAADALRGQLGHEHRVWELSGHRQALASLDSQHDPANDEMLRRGRAHTFSSAAATALALLDRPLP